MCTPTKDVYRANGKNTLDSAVTEGFVVLVAAPLSFRVGMLTAAERDDGGVYEEGDGANARKTGLGADATRSCFQLAASGDRDSGRDVDIG